MEKTKITLRLPEARARIEAFKRVHGPGPHKAPDLASALWPGRIFEDRRRAGASAGPVLKMLKLEQVEIEKPDRHWEWMI